MRLEPLVESRKVHVALIILITIAAYANTIQSPFFFDDHDFILNWEKTRTFASIPDFFAGELPQAQEGVYRPLRSIYYTIAYHLFGLSSAGYHLQSIIIHSIASLLAYAIISRILRNAGAALAGGLFFAVHPLHTEAVNTLAASFDIIGCIWYLLAFYLYIRYREDERERKWLAISIMSAMLAFFSYEIALTLPLMLLLYDLCFRRLAWKNSLKESLRYLPYAAGIITYLFIRFVLLDITSRGQYLAGSFYHTMLASMQAVALYLGLTLLPIGFNFIHILPGGISTYTYADHNTGAILAQSLFSPQVLIAMVIITACAAIALLSWRKHPMLAFSIGWFFIAIAPVLNIIPQATLITEYHLYLALFGFCLIAAHLFSSRLFLAKVAGTKGAKIAAMAIAVLLILSYTALTIDRNRDYQDEEQFWEITVGGAKDSALAHGSLGIVYSDKGKVDEAITEFTRALAINPGYADIHNNLGVAYGKKGQYEKAIEHITTAISLQPERAAYYDNLKIAQSLTDKAR